jgi:hypothetical protein
MQRTPEPMAYLPTIIILVLFGWGGLIALMTATDPELGPRWLFFFLVVVAFTGIALPLSVVLNARFPSNPPATPNVVVRQALWVGIFASVVAWLLYGRVFNLGIASIFLVGFAAVEVFLRLWERSQWRRPK